MEQQVGTISGWLGKLPATLTMENHNIAKQVEWFTVQVCWAMMQCHARASQGSYVTMSLLSADM